MIGGRATSPWAEAGTWVGGDLRREVFFFRSRGVLLYGSLFAGRRITRPFGVVCCNSWGVEADRSDPLQRAVALAMARLGGAGLVFHYPGYGDSFGDLARADLETLVEAAVDARAAAVRRCPGLRWILAGFMLGAAVACLASPRDRDEMLLLVQPALRPGDYFRRLAATRQPLAPGPSPREMMEAGTAPGMAYGYPVPAAILGRAEEVDAAVEEALAAFPGGGAVVAHPPSEGSGSDHLPSRLRRLDVAGRWRFGTQSNPRLARTAVEWLGEVTGGDR